MGCRSRYAGYPVDTAPSRSIGAGRGEPDGCPFRASWSWYQGGASGTLLSSGSISDTSKGTTVQPATADTVFIGLTQPSGKGGCGTSQTFSFSPGSHIDFTVTLKEQADAYHGPCFDTFSMKS
jgi:hypothetical protein